MADLPLTKTLQREDFAALPPELEIVRRQSLAGQTPEARDWEYALALRAFAEWGGKATHRVVDVGGAGSPFWRMLGVDNVFVVDPHQGMDLATYLGTNPPLADAVFCLSVIEHVPDLDQFLYHLSCLVRPGGLLFLTMDCWGNDGVDTAHFHWMRERIFSMEAWRDLRSVFKQHALKPFGGIADTYYGDTLYGSYSIASLCLVKDA